MKFLEDATLADKKVLVRIDTDVPLTDSNPIEVRDDYRLQKLLPTLFFLMNHRAKIILCGHLGRPLAKADPSLSMKPVFTHLSALANKKILFATDPFSLRTTEAIEKMDDGDIIGLENIRFFRGEEDNSRTFARKLSNLAEIYVNEAFGTSHREAASVVAITEFLPSYAGLQLEQEINVSTSLTRHPAHPFIAIVGGAKISDKLPVIRNLLPKVDRIIVGGGVANTFLASQGVDMKNSKVEEDYIDRAGEILKNSKGKIILPVDYVWESDKILDIGEEATHQMIHYIKSAKTILWSGVPGKIEQPPFDKSSKAIAKAIANSPATSIVGGGDTVGFVNSLGLVHKYSFVSTGGSALLELLGGRVLPGIRALG
ncbi:MAG: phosphoglycerate kinase [Candidatus Berkelbacteria bacterium]|nr:phosphoglycerate kinase [Candidatus Berkelbacteria bacterium]MCR4308282.1 phosphoglycerate kinase [Candidatus Berkelbacteria bacterium]